MAPGVLDNPGSLHRDQPGVRGVGLSRRAVVEHVQGRPEQTADRGPGAEQDACQRRG